MIQSVLFVILIFIKCNYLNGPLAQLVEQQTLNLWVASSILAWLITLDFQDVNYGAYSSAVERQIVDLVVVGSIPTRHPKVH